MQANGHGARLNAATLPLVAVTAECAARLLAADPRYQQACDSDSPEVKGNRLQLAVNVAIGLVTIASEKIEEQRIIGAGPKIG